MRKKRSGFVTASRKSSLASYPSARIAPRCCIRQRVYGGTHYLVARFAFYVGDQAETTAILQGFIVQHISEPPAPLRDALPTDGARAQQEHA